MATKIVEGTRDPKLTAVVRSRLPLLYSDGPDPALDRPAHVRAGSALVRVGTAFAVVQDDASFLALIEMATGRVEGIALPAGPGGRRQFDDERGNKADKLDLEACVVLAAPGGGERLVAFGSGSTAARERILVVDRPTSDSREVRLVDGARFYAALRAETAFSGSELNIEGAVVLGPDLFLFQRGNGAPKGKLQPVDATCRVPAAALVAFLDDPARAKVPAPQGVVQHRLGELEGVRLTFTDAATKPPATVMWLAAAEDCPDAVRDGEVKGVAIGVLGDKGSRWAPLTDAKGQPFKAKAEGIALAPLHPSFAFVVVDQDDPNVPSELCRVQLGGPWGI